jgi:hypothetical protein
MELRKGHLHCYMLTTDNTTNFGTGELFFFGGGVGPLLQTATYNYDKNYVFVCFPYLNTLKVS